MNAKTKEKIRKAQLGVPKPRDKWHIQEDILKWEQKHGKKKYLHPEDFSVPKWLGGKDATRKGK